MYWMGAVQITNPKPEEIHPSIHPLAHIKSTVHVGSMALHCIKNELKMK
jgi:hypothetical protein